MASKNDDRGKRKNWEEKYKELQKEHRRLRAEFAKVEAERDGYLQSLHFLMRKPISISKKELREMRKNPLGIEDVLQELEQEARKQEARKHG